MMTEEIILKIISRFNLGYGTRRIAKELDMPEDEITRLLLRRRRTPHPDTPSLAQDSWDIRVEEYGGP
jgi:hypothetical protein